MKKIRYKKTTHIITTLLAITVLSSGCGQNGNESMTSAPSAPSTTNQPSGITIPESTAEDSSVSTSSEDISSESPTVEAQNLEVRFGDDGEVFLMHLYDNDTAEAIARHVGSSDWRLPIYNYDESDSMEYYDIPSRYEIPGSPENITAAKAGEVYYSDPNRIIVFYADAEFSGEYTKVGEFDVTEAFQSAVRDNPVLEDWGNKIVLISTVD